MIITRLEGGLGNQMFQYAMGKVLAIKNHDDLKLDLSIFHYLMSDPKITKYKYALGVFPAITEPAATLWDFKLLAPIMIPQIAQRWQSIYSASKLGSFKIVKENDGFTYDPSILQQNGNIFLLGFWQHPRYMALQASKLRKLFTFHQTIQATVESLLNDIPAASRVSVHVRRGDYLAIGLGACSIAYYKKAAALIKKKVKNPYFIVVSNDIEWARQNLSFLKNVRWIDPKNGSEAIDLCLMSKCHHHIIANSTFSWWGAWLNPHKNKVVIAPQPWFDWPTFKAKTPVLTDWIQLPKG